MNTNPTRMTLLWSYTELYAQYLKTMPTKFDTFRIVSQIG